MKLFSWAAGAFLFLAGGVSGVGVEVAMTGKPATAAAEALVIFVAGCALGFFVSLFASTR